MASKAPSVNTRRPYDTSRRREKARQSHEALLDAALARFLQYGYLATTVESIAHDASTSTATIYKSYGGKPGLVRALCVRARSRAAVRHRPSCDRTCSEMPSPTRGG